MDARLRTAEQNPELLLSKPTGVCSDSSHVIVGEVGARTPFSSEVSTAALDAAVGVVVGPGSDPEMFRVHTPGVVARVHDTFIRWDIETSVLSGQPVSLLWPTIMPKGTVACDLRGTGATPLMASARRHNDIFQEPGVSLVVHTKNITPNCFSVKEI